MNHVLRGWHIARILRLILGCIIVWNALATGDWGIAIIGTVLVLAAIVNVGCCGIHGTCAIKGKTSEVSVAEDIEYEELH